VKQPIQGEQRRKVSEVRVWNKIEALLIEVVEGIVARPSQRRSADRKGRKESGMKYQSTNPD
jgi:hypothetical protein